MYFFMLALEKKINKIRNNKKIIRINNKKNPMKIDT